MSHLLYGGRALSQWVLDGGRALYAPNAYALRLRWHAFWFEHNWSTQTARLAEYPLPADPVFILGPWRSGTTALHELLANITAWPTPQTWQCFNPSTCFLVSAPPREAQLRRPMDEGLISSRGPQEDEFAALLLGEESVYRGFIDPRRLGSCGKRLWPDLSEASGSSAATDLPRWQSFLRGVARAGADENRTQRLLVKSPNHTFRLPQLRRWFPRAQYVWMARRSQEVVASNLKMWRAMMARYALWRCPDGELEGFIDDALGSCARVMSYCIEELAADRLLWVDFEEFRTEPRLVLLRVLNFLGIRAEAAHEQQLDAALARLPVHAGSRSIATATANSERLDQLMVAAHKRFGSGGVARGSANR